MSSDDGLLSPLTAPKGSTIQQNVEAQELTESVQPCRAKKLTEKGMYNLSSKYASFPSTYLVLIFVRPPSAAEATPSTRESKEVKGVLT
jgi:hypothetical protein